MPASIYEVGLNTNAPLTTIAQGLKQPYLVMQYLYPLVETVNYTGQIMEFDDGAFEEVVDDRADAAPYPEIAEAVYGAPYELSTKGLKRKIGRKEADVRSAMGIDWGRRATRTLMRHAGRRHETEAAIRATTFNDYATSNRITLTTDTQFNNPAVDPMTIIRPGKSVVAGEAGVDPNVAIMGRECFDSLAGNPFIKDMISGNPLAQRAMLQGNSSSASSITEQAMAIAMGFQALKVCNLVRRSTGGQKVRVFGKHFVMGYTNPDAVAALMRQEADDVMPRISYAVNRQITDEEPSMGYTLVKNGQPRVLGPIPNDEDQYVAYLLDFDRRVINAGVDRDTKKIIFGYMIQNAVA